LFGCLYFRILLAERDTCADWLKGVEPQDDPATKGKKKDDGFHIKVPSIGMMVLLLHRYMFLMVDIGCWSFLYTGTCF
jgi:hypothetical protein